MATGVWNHGMAHPLANAANSGATGSGGADGSTSTITANDFLTLLVTEMKNQDPTAATDPNEYINQLVQVNSLQQLIAIHQDLSDSLGSSSTNGNAGVKTTAAQETAWAGRSAPAHTASAAKPGTATVDNARPAPEIMAGNLGVPRTGGTAYRIAEALGGHK